TRRDCSACSRDSTKRTRRRARAGLKGTASATTRNSWTQTRSGGAHIAVPMHPYWVEFGLGAGRTALMNNAIAVMESLGATVETFEIPSQNVLNNYGTCVTAADVAARRATPVGTIPACSTVLLFGFKRDLNAYLASKDFGPGTSASSSTIPVQTVKTLSDVISFNSAHPEVALKYGQAIAEAADVLDIGSGQDLDDYLADRALDLKLTRTFGLDVLYTGLVREDLAGPIRIVKFLLWCDVATAIMVGEASFGRQKTRLTGSANWIPPAGIHRRR